MIPMAKRTKQVVSGLVVVISGTSGAGKTSLVRKTAALLGEAVCLHFDDYKSVSMYPADLTAWVASGSDPNEWQTPQLAQDVRALRSGCSISIPGSAERTEPKPYIVLEDPFGRAREEMAPSIDFAAYIDVPLDVAMARKLRREVLGVARDRGSEEAIRRLDSFLSSFLDESLREVYIAANESARASSDLVLDGMRPREDLARELVGRVSALKS
jgi:uridine kinase